MAMSGSGGSKKTNHADDIMNLGGGGAFSAALAAPVLTAPPLDSGDAGPGSAAAAFNKKLLIGAIGVGALLIMCMIGMFLALRPKAELATGPEGSGSAAVAPIPGGPAAAASSVAATDPGPAAPLAVADPPKAAAPNVGVPSRGSPGRSNAAVTQPSMPAMPMPATPKGPQTLEQQMTQATGGVRPAAAVAPAGGSTDPFDRGAASATLGSIDVSSCKKTDGPSGPGHVRITFSPNGTVQTAIVDQPPYAGTAVGGCVAGKFRSAHVPPFAGGPTPVGKSFVIN